MNKLLAIAWNDIRHQFADRSELVFFLVLPLLFTLVLAAAQGGGDDPNADLRNPLLVVDEDKSEVSARLGEALAASAVMRPVFKTRAEAESQFEQKDNTNTALLTIPAGFGQALMAGQPAELSVRKHPNDSRALTVEPAIRVAADQVSTAVLAARAAVAEAEQIRPFASDAARQAYFQQSIDMAQDLLKNPPARVEATQAAQVVRQGMSGAEQSSAGQLVTWCLITLIAASEGLLFERLEGTLRRMVITPTSKAIILTGKIAGRLGSGLVQMAVLIGVGALLLGVNWGRSPLALALIVVSFALAAVAFGVLLGTFAKTRSQAGWLSVMFGMVTAALGGAWWPLEITPPIYQTVVKALPTTWAMIGFNDVLVRGESAAGVLPEVAILLAFAVVFFGIGVRRFRFE